MDRRKQGVWSVSTLLGEQGVSFKLMHGLKHTRCFTSVRRDQATSSITLLYRITQQHINIHLEERTSRQHFREYTPHAPNVDSLPVVR